MNLMVVVTNYLGKSVGNQEQGIQWFFPDHIPAMPCLLSVLFDFPGII